MRAWTLEYDSNYDNHPPVVTSGPAISPEEMSVEVIEKSAFDEARNLLLTLRHLDNHTIKEELWRINDFLIRYGRG